MILLLPTRWAVNRAMEGDGGKSNGNGDKEGKGGKKDGDGDKEGKCECGKRDKGSKQRRGRWQAATKRVMVTDGNTTGNGNHCPLSSAAAAAAVAVGKDDKGRGGLFLYGVVVKKIGLCNYQF